jgi:hypothetical protein
MCGQTSPVTHQEMYKFLLLTAARRAVLQYIRSARATLDSTIMRVSGKIINNIKQYIHRQAVQLVFDLDEVGSSDWQDYCEKRVIVSTVFAGCVIHHKKGKSTIHVRDLVCLTVAKDLLTLYLVISQNLNSTVRDLSWAST